MEDYQERFCEEYKEVKDRYEKLHKMFVRYDAGTLDPAPNCPIHVLRDQAAAMERYIYILEVRAEIEHIDFERASKLGSTEKK